MRKHKTIGFYIEGFTYTYARDYLGLNAVSDWDSEKMLAFRRPTLSLYFCNMCILSIFFLYFCILGIVSIFWNFAIFWIFDFVI